MPFHKQQKREERGLTGRLGVGGAFGPGQVDDGEPGDVGIVRLRHVGEADNFDGKDAVAVEQYRREVRDEGGSRAGQEAGGSQGKARRAGAAPVTFEMNLC